MVKKVLFTVTVLMALLGTPSIVRADDGDGDGESDGCATKLLQCYESAAKVDNFWYRWAAGIDCELQFTNCARIMIAGR